MSVVDVTASKLAPDSVEDLMEVIERSHRGAVEQVAVVHGGKS